MCLLVVHSLMDCLFKLFPHYFNWSLLSFFKHTFNFCFLDILFKNLDLSHGCESIVFFQKVYGPSLSFSRESLLLFWYAARGAKVHPCFPASPHPSPHTAIQLFLHYLSKILSSPPLNVLGPFLKLNGVVYFQTFILISLMCVLFIQFGAFFPYHSINLFLFPL